MSSGQSESRLAKEHTGVNRPWCCLCFCSWCWVKQVVKIKTACKQRILNTKPIIIFLLLTKTSLWKCKCYFTLRDIVTNFCWSTEILYKYMLIVYEDKLHVTSVMAHKIKQNVCRIWVSLLKILTSSKWSTWHFSSAWDGLK